LAFTPHEGAITAKPPPGEKRAIRGVLIPFSAENSTLHGVVFQKMRIPGGASAEGHCLSPPLRRRVQRPV
jgi:hypothetical protein